VKQERKKMKLSSADQEDLAAFWAFWWCVVVLEPRAWQRVRHLMADFGLVEKRGTLRLTKKGERIMRQFKRSGKVTGRPVVDRELSKENQ
jgi:hypothetical protein